MNIISVAAKFTRLFFVFVCTLLSAQTAHAQSTTLDRVRDRGVLFCGVSTNLSGFAQITAAGASGFEVDYCRAIAAAVLSDPQAVEFVSLRADEAIPALRLRRVDVLTRMTTRSFTSDTQGQLHFSQILLFDTLRILVRPSLGVRTLQDLSGQKLCVERGSGAHYAAEDFLKYGRVDFQLELMGTSIDTILGLSAGQCQAVLAPVSRLNAMMTLTQDVNFGELLPEIVDDYQVSIATRHGDDEWGDIVNWVANATIIGEELGLGKAELAEGFRFTPDAHKNALSLMGLNFSIGAPLRLDDSWAFRVLEAVGNYGEIYERNLGSGSVNRSIRGFNRLASQGGMIWAPPLR